MLLYLSLIFWSLSGSLEGGTLDLPLSCPSDWFQPEGIISTVIIRLSDRLLPNVGGTAKRKREPGRIPELLLLWAESGVEAVAAETPDTAGVGGLLIGAREVLSDASREVSSPDSLLLKICCDLAVVSEVEILADSSLPSLLLLENRGVHLFLKDDDNQDPVLLLSESGL